VDPIPELAGLAAEHGVLFHVDAVWEGSCSLSIGNWDRYFRIST
jgi:glutamate/tyrosine decarboxylase-like PLP-dependent enzyme